MTLERPDTDERLEPDEPRVRTERQGRILVIQMFREHKRNAIDAAMTRALDRALNELEDDPELWCGVLTGTPLAFSAGTDLAVGAGEPTQRGGSYGLIRRTRRTPLVAAVEGLALGGGFELVLSCDMVVAGESARFALPEVARGVIPTCGGLFRGWQALPLPLAKELVLTGRELSAPRAAAFGLVNEVVPDGQALSAAVALADLVCANSPVAVSESLQAIDAVVADMQRAGWASTDAALAKVLESNDHREGIEAFLKKRQPRWTGR